MNVEELKKKRTSIRNSIYATSKRKDSVEKFDKLISLTKEYKNLTFELTLEGGLNSINSEKLREDYWKHRLDEYILEQENDNTELKNKTNRKWNITICWSVRPDYCVCDHVVDKVRKYLKTMGLKNVGNEKTEFDERVEFREIYQFKGPKVVYDTYLKSAEYILLISSDSIHDVCNVGVYGKKLE